MFVIDCSLTMAWLFEDEKTAFSEGLLDRLKKDRGVVPSLWLFEVLNVLIMGEKRQRISHSQTSHFLNVLNQLPIQIVEVNSVLQSESMLFLARAHHLTSYGASYLDLASRPGLPLASLDEQLIKAAQSLGVETLHA